nr:ABC transporter substrate-binding protein [Desulfobulbaceae bacterium]
MKNNKTTYLNPLLLLSCLVFTGLMASVFSQAEPVRAESITDQSGAEISFAKPFTRIISLYPAHTENLFALGLDQEIIGVSKNDTYPQQTREKPKFHYREDPEKFIAALPDLVLVRPMIYRAYPDLISKLNLAGIVVISLQPTSIAETYSYWRTLGTLTGRAAQAEELIRHFKIRVAGITEKVATISPETRQKVYFEAIHKKMKTFSPGSITVFALETAGGINIAADAEIVRDTNIAYYGKEKILSKSREIDVFLAQNGKMNRITEEIIKNEPGFKAIKAIENDTICIVDEAIVSRPTVRLLEGIETIGRCLYPEVFR